MVAINDGGNYTHIDFIFFCKLNELHYYTSMAQECLHICPLIQVHSEAYSLQEGGEGGIDSREKKGQRVEKKKSISKIATF